MKMQNANGNKDHVGKLQNIVENRQKQDQDVLNKFVATITDREKQARIIVEACAQQGKNMPKLEQPCKRQTHIQEDNFS